MKIAANTVVAIHYTLTNDDGEVLDSSQDSEPLTYMHGSGQIIPGLEAALEGHASGDAFKVTVAPKDGYGEKQVGNAVRVPRSELPAGAEPEVGMELEAQGPDGESVVLWVLEVDDDAVMLSTDHPLAGETLHFDVNVGEVRAATAEELSHGHAHGPGAEHHH